MITQAEVTLYVTGIFCTNCSALLQDVLSNLKGAFGVSIDLIKEVICVSYDPEYVPGTDLANTVTSKGYEVNDMNILAF